jgi:uncharacterized protein
MLLLNLARIRAAHEHFEHVYGPETFAADEGIFSVAAPVVLAFDVAKDKDQFRVAGRIETVLELPCSRCLEPFRWPVDAPFDLRYQPRSRKTVADEREIEEDDFSTAFYENDALDLGQLMSEQFYLALPMKPLCRPDCRGLCSQCGTNLNRDGCGCERGWADPRLAAFREPRTRHETRH